MKIGILCGYRFPEGMAPTNRIIAYSKGLIENGANLLVVVFRPTEYELLNFPTYGKIQTLPYIYPFKRKWSKSSILRWIWDRPISYLKTINYIVIENRKEKFDFLFLSFDAIQNLIFFSVILKKLKIKTVFIGDEYPIPIRHFLKDSLPLWKVISYKVVFRFIDAKVLMTQNLSNFFNKIRVTPTYILSSITDVSRFAEIKLDHKFNQRKYLCYMGNMELAKDNVDLIINAFKLISDRFSDIDLLLFGSPSFSDYQRLKLTIYNLKLENRVKLMGRVNYNVVPEVLSNAYILVSSQPKTLRASGGFPTKLGEYLSTGVPTILTNVGEISHYITHGEHAWLTKPEDIDDYALKLSFIIENYDLAKEVAEKGRLLVYENFSPKTSTKGLFEFLSQLP